MILGIDEIHRRVREQKLLEDLSERELSNPEGAGIDLRIRELYALKGEGFLGVEERHTPEMELIATYEEGKTTEVSLESGEYYAMTTIETVNTPEDVLISFFPRSTLYRSGVTILSGNCSPGYRGKLTFGIVNLSKRPFRLEMGARVAHAIFHEVKGSSNMYRGQWQDGRVSTEGEKESQV